jgi:hypothetical protein
VTVDTPPQPVPVCFVASGQAGGAERYLETLLDAIDDAWIEGVILLGDGPFAETLRSRQIEVTVLDAHGKPGLVSASFALRRMLRSRCPAVVHANGIKPAAVAGIAALGTSIPVLWKKVDLAWDGWRSHLVAQMCAEVVGMSSVPVSH